MAFINHKTIEKNPILLVVLVLLTVSVGGLVEIVPLFMVKSTIEKVEGMRPYSPLELAGRKIYVREGCFVCHSQMIRSLRSEVDRYGHYSLAAESMYDHPFQWGSKRNGPDLARVGGKYSDEWHYRHMINPREVVPESIMPGYPFLVKPLAQDTAVRRVKGHAAVGVPYTDDMLANIEADLAIQANPEADYDALEAFMARYPKAVARDFDGNPDELTEMDALIAYMQMLGTLVDYDVYDEKANAR